MNFFIFQQPLSSLTSLPIKFSILYCTAIYQFKVIIVIIAIDCRGRSCSTGWSLFMPTFHQIWSVIAGGSIGYQQFNRFNIIITTDGFIFIALLNTILFHFDSIFKEISSLITKKKRNKNSKSTSCRFTETVNNLTAD